MNIKTINPVNTDNVISNEYLVIAVNINLLSFLTLRFACSVFVLEDNEMETSKNLYSLFRNIVTIIKLNIISNMTNNPPVIAMTDIISLYANTNISCVIKAVASNDNTTTIKINVHVVILRNVIGDLDFGANRIYALDRNTIFIVILAIINEQSEK